MVVSKFIVHVFPLHVLPWNLPTFFFICVIHVCFLHLPWNPYRFTITFYTYSTLVCQHCFLDFTLDTIFVQTTFLMYYFTTDPLHIHIPFVLSQFIYESIHPQYLLDALFRLHSWSTICQHYLSVFWISLIPIYTHIIFLT